MKDTTIIILAAAGLAAVYLITKPKPVKQTTGWDVLNNITGGATKLIPLFAL